MIFVLAAFKAILRYMCPAGHRRDMPRRTSMDFTEEGTWIRPGETICASQP